MILDTRKITLIASIALIAALAVGIGFAYAAYTSNNGNNTDVAYITLTQAGEIATTPYTFADNVTIALDTYNKDDASTIYYRLSGSDTVKCSDTSFGTYKCALLGTIELHAEFTGPTTATPPASLDISISGSDKFDATDTWMYFITDEPNPSTRMTSHIYAYKDTNKNVSEWTAKDALTMDLASGTTYDNVTIYVYYGYSTDNQQEIDGMWFLDDDEPPKKLEGASIMIKASSDNATHIITYKSNGGTGADFYVTVPTGSTYPLVENAEDIGFNAPTDKVFKGWSYTPNGAIISASSITVNNDTPLYAIWGDPTS